MTHFAKLDEAFMNHQGSGHMGSRRPHVDASNSSSSSIRAKRTRSSVPSSQDSPQRLHMRGGSGDFNENYQIRDTEEYHYQPHTSLPHKNGPSLISPHTSHYPRVEPDYYQERVIPRSLVGSDCEGSDYCLSLINQVLQNDWCKKILRNILLEEYMDRFLKSKIDSVSNCSGRPVYKYTHDDNPNISHTYANGYSNSDNSEQSGGIGDLLPSGTIWGLDLRTLTIIGLVVLGGFYFYDFFQRLFR